MLKSLLKNLAKRILLADDLGRHEFLVETVSLGKTEEERYQFWADLHEMLQTAPGKAFLALMQKEFALIESELLEQRTPLERRAELLAQLRQQSFVLHFPKEVKRQMNERASKLNARA